MERHKAKTVIILTTSPFPIGLASTSRILSYCKGFIHHGYQPEVICIRPTEAYSTVFNTSAVGNLQGVAFSYPGGTTIRVKSFLGRRKNDLSGIFHSIIFLFRYLNKKETAFVIFYGNSLVTELLCIMIARLFRVKIFKEESENPEVYFAGRKSIFSALHKWFFIKRLYRLYSGILVMTHPLQDFFLKKGVPERKILVVPQTVDVTRFDTINTQNEMSLPESYIAFVGSLNQQKDGALSLLKAFSRVTGTYPGYQLVLAGNGSPEEVSELNTLIHNLDLSERINFIGRISSEKIPELFARASLLVSCRPESLQGDYGFPTKVGEYLASGKPVVTTATGELAYFLKDRVNAFVAKSADPEDFASKILEALQEYNFALQVGQAGKNLASEEFNPVKQAKMIIEFSS